VTELWEIFHILRCKQALSSKRKRHVNEVPGDRFRAIHELHERHGYIVRIRPNQLTIASPTALRPVFVRKCSSFLKTDFYANIQQDIGPKYSGLFNYIDHSRAMAERRDIQPALAPGNISMYAQRCDRRLDKLVEQIKKHAEIDLSKYLHVFQRHPAHVYSHTWSDTAKHPVSKFLMLDTVGDLALNQSFDQLVTGEEHQYVVDFNNAFMLIGLVRARLIPQRHVWAPSD
jgi:hypothetical protein